MEAYSATNDENVVMTGGSFTAEAASEENSSLVRSQPRSASRADSIAAKRPPPDKAKFDDAHCERDWSSPLCTCKDERRNCCCLFCCWPYFKYMVATRLGETPFMALIPCATFALRIKVRTLFGLKGSLLKDFGTSLCCEPCAVCQMSRELDHIGL